MPSLNFSFLPVPISARPLAGLTRFGVLSSDEQALDDVLRLTTQRFLERRLQTRVYKMNFAKSVHHARALIYQRHIRVGKQLVNQANFLVRGDSESHIDFSLASAYNTATGKPGRVARKKAKKGAAPSDD